MSTNRKTRNVALTVKQDKFVNDLVNYDQYQSASEVVKAGLRLLDHDIERHQVELDEIRRGVLTSLKAEAQRQYVEGAPKEVISAVFDESIKTRGV